MGVLQVEVPEPPIHLVWNQRDFDTGVWGTTLGVTLIKKSVEGDREKVIAPFRSITLY